MKNKFRKLNDKAKFHLEQLLEEIHHEAYAKGFNDASALRKHDSISGVRPSMVVFEEKSIIFPNQERAELIQKAKKFVEEQKDSYGDFTTIDAVCTASFYRKNNRVTCVLKGFASGKVYAVGRANCSPNDVFNLYLGQAIALARALKIRIPVEFLKAVQPIELAVGHVTIWSDDFDTTYTVKEIEDNKAYCNDLTQHWKLPLCNEHLCNIIDDTNAQYEVA